MHADGVQAAGHDDASTGLEGIESSPRWARPHVRGGGGWVALMPKPAYYRCPAAGVNASISDMAQWLIAQTGHRPTCCRRRCSKPCTPGDLDPDRTARFRMAAQRLSSAGYAIGWRVFDYAGHEAGVPRRRGAGLPRRGGVLPDRDLGVAILWNSEKRAAEDCCRPSSTARSACLSRMDRGPSPGDADAGGQRHNDEANPRPRPAAALHPRPGAARIPTQKNPSRLGCGKGLMRIQCCF